jgi:O-antigen biosynthesis protein
MQDGYYTHARPDVLGLVPRDARTVLDVGCGAGDLGAAIMARQQAEVVGIEPCEAAVPTARQRITRVWPDTVEGWLIDPDYDYDCIICADVLEHLQDPEEVLRSLHACLADAGRLVVSVPNARNWNVIARLLEGNVAYEDAGLLDRTHLRLFTRRELEMMLWRAGYEVEDLRPVLDQAHQQWVAAGRPRQVGVPPFIYHAPTEQDAEDLFTYQWLCRARKREPQPSLSIIIPVWNQLDYTRECLAALARTCPDAQVIVVDNGSTDGTGEWLSEWQDGGLRQVVTSPENRGFAWACNRGLEAATGDVQVLLNNDTLPGAGWTDALLDAFSQAPDIGAVGPVSNYVSGPQQVATPCTRRDQIEGWAWEWQRSNRGLWVGTERLVGFCLALRREAIAEVGLLDERFGLGTYEDDDYCRRLRAAGWRLLIAPGSFVWHWGNRTFLGNGVSMEDCQEQNAVLYAEKWARITGGQTVAAQTTTEGE